jgi:hypothetical protein
MDSTVEKIGKMDDEELLKWIQQKKPKLLWECCVCTVERPWPGFGDGV